MLFNRLMVLFILLQPIQAWCAYDAENVKTGINNNNALFKVTQWTKSSTEKSWTATTNLQRVTIFVGEKHASLVAPFINPQQIKTAKTLCKDFAEISTQANDDESRRLIKEAIRAATTRHKLKYLTVNNVKFSVTPKLIGSVVSLYCSIKAV